MRKFLNFIREQGVVGLAIGFIIGGSAKNVVSSLSDDIVSPVIGLIFGSPEGLRGLSVNGITYGNFIVELIDFAIIALVIFILFKQLKLEKLDKKK